MTNLRWSWVGSLGLLLAVSACSLRPDSATDLTNKSDRDSPVDSQVTDLSWSTIHPIFATSLGAERFSDSSLQIGMIIAVDGGYLAIGGFDGNLAMWWSDDLRNFELVHVEEGGDRWISVGSAVFFDDKIVLGATGAVFSENRDSQSERSFLLISSDHGRSWSEVDHEVFSSPGQRLDQLVVSGSTLIADLVVDVGGRPVPDPWKTNDLVNWEPVMMPGIEGEVWPVFGSDGTRPVAFSRHYDYVNNTPVFAAWTQDEDTSNFQSVDDLLVDISDGVAIGGQIVAWPRVGAFGPGETSPHSGVSASPYISQSDGSWKQLELNNGQWGDSAIPRSVGHDRATGRVYVLLVRTDLDPHRCYEFPEGCYAAETVLISSSDGENWFDVDTEKGEFDRNTQLVVGDSGEMFLWKSPEDGPRGEILIHHWSGPGLPALEAQEPVGPAPHPVPFYWSGPLPIGAEMRHGLGLGGCGSGLFIDGESWDPEEPMPHSAPSSWPSVATRFDDGPSEIVYGRIERTEEDTIVFSVEGTGLVGTFHRALPRDPDAVSC